jgi:SLT domain-containing protein
MPRKSKAEAAAATTTRAPSKLDRLVTILSREAGADMPAMIEATGWQAHSIRGAMAGALKKKGQKISSEKLEERRVWRIVATAQEAQS